MSGYVRLYRSLLDNPAFRNDAEAMAFGWMILRASWKLTRVRYKGRAVALNRGQLVTSIRDMADAMDRDKAWIERLFKRLKAETMIETVTEAGLSVITICNYGQYQAEREDDETRRETLGETVTRQRRDTEQVREIREEDNVVANATTPRERASVVRGSRIPSDWTPTKALPPSVADLTAQWPPGRLDRELEGFRDYWIARTRDAAKSDWDRAWWNRIRDQHDRVMKDARNGRLEQPKQEWRNPRPIEAIPFQPKRDNRSASEAKAVGEGFKALVERLGGAQT